MLPVDLKVATLVHRSLSGISPSYLADDCRLVAEHALWRRHTALSAIEHLQLLDPDYGTVFHRT